MMKSHVTSYDDMLVRLNRRDELHDLGGQRVQFETYVGPGVQFEGNLTKYPKLRRLILSVLRIGIFLSA